MWSVSEAGWGLALPGSWLPGHLPLLAVSRVSGFPWIHPYSCMGRGEGGSCKENLLCVEHLLHTSHGGEMAGDAGVPDVALST